MSPSSPRAPAAAPRVLLVFADGVGIGAASDNPFARAHLPRLSALLGGRRLVAEDIPAAGVLHTSGASLSAADATLGLSGTPQSGTGQTTLLTGWNAAAAYGRHFGPWVPTPLRAALERDSILMCARAAGRGIAFANAYPIASLPADPRHFRRPAAPPLAARAAGVLVRDLAQLARGDAVASSITNEHWRARVGDDLGDVTPDEAGRRLARIAAGAEVTLFAHYDTDIVGHRGDMASAIAALEKLDAFLGATVDALPPDALLVLASDHGNVERISGGHTRNPVPVLAVGAGAAAFAERVRGLADVTPALLHAVGVDCAATHHPP